jgi:hypothetical protein
VRQRRRRNNFQTRRARQSTPSGKTRIDDARSLRVPPGVGKAEIAKSDIAKSGTAKTFPDGIVFDARTVRLNRDGGACLQNFELSFLRDQIFTEH